ncbi:TlpA family protein disulfide reductase [Saccharicrinis aurantiacus]|uniref:TlpA family protein disulfide reductase n=1 Tax=Saccharicrinis aurantiacus TaxID=1849719 RepID=UPI00249350C4|nr:TlpA disulfide reductase family protein [Saccharicrinis aurantiacus]
MKTTLLFFASLFIIVSCTNNKQVTISVKAEYTESDTLTIRDLTSDKVLAKFASDNTGLTHTFNIDYPIAGALSSKVLDQGYLLYLHPNKNIEITITNNKQISSNNVCDSLLNYLHFSQNEFLATNGGFVFTTNNNDSIAALFDQFRLKREKEIYRFKNKLTKDEIGFLEYQNSARIYSFLFYFGRVAKQLDLKSSYYNFCNNIQGDNNWCKTLPDILIYKYEVDFVREYDSITDLGAFIKYIKLHCNNNDYLDFFIATYLEGLISHPSYWPQHDKCLNAEVLNALVESEKDNKYFSIIKKTSDSYFQSQKGEHAYNFTAIDKQGNKVELSDFEGKVVLIDAWATWCGPCLKHRPAIKDFAKKYQDNSNVAILMVSVDEKRDRWLDFIEKDNPSGNGIDLYIKNGRETKFGDSFNVKSIPRYILIDKQGIIHNANIAEPSIILEEMIEKLLK